MAGDGLSRPDAPPPGPPRDLVDAVDAPRPRDLLDDIDAAAPSTPTRSESAADATAVDVPERQLVEQPGPGAETELREAPTADAAAATAVSEPSNATGNIVTGDVKSDEAGGLKVNEPVAPVAAASVTAMQGTDRTGRGPANCSDSAEATEGKSVSAEVVTEGKSVSAEVVTEGKSVSAAIVTEGKSVSAEVTEGKSVSAEVTEGKSVSAAVVTEEKSVTVVVVTEEKPVSAEIVTKVTSVSSEVAEGDSVSAEIVTQGGPVSAELVTDGGPVSVRGVPPGGTVSVESRTEGRDSEDAVRLGQTAAEATAAGTPENADLAAREEGTPTGQDSGPSSPGQEAPAVSEERQVVSTEEKKQEIAEGQRAVESRQQVVAEKEQDPCLEKQHSAKLETDIDVSEEQRSTTPKEQQRADPGAPLDNASEGPTGASGPPAERQLPATTAMEEKEQKTVSDTEAMPAPAAVAASAPAAAAGAAGQTAAGAAAGAPKVHRSQPNLRAVPTRSNLKRKSDDGTAGSAPKRPRRSIQFDGVTVFYFPRAQGFTCIPSQGGSTLGMADAHSHVEQFTLTDHVNEQRMAHRELLTRLRVKQRKLQRLPPFQPSASSSEESDAGSEEGSDLSDSELDVDSYFFLRPVSTRQRRALLRASGVRKIEPMEKDECRDIRTSREFCGCACKVVCRPDNCQCAGAGIKCQVDRQNFPCGCTRDGCQNPIGRIEFNPNRVRSHFVETIMREQPPTAAAGPSGPGSAWASCGWQKAAGCAAAPGQQYMAEQELSSGYSTGGGGGGGGGFTDLSAPYQEESSYSENSDGSSDGSYETAAAAAPGYQPPQTQSHYSSFSFEGGLQNYGPPQGAAPPYPAGLGGYPQPYTACQSYPAGAHAYPAPAPHYSYSFKYPTSGPGPGPGGGGAPAANGAPPTGYPPSCGYPTYPTVAGCSYEPPPPVYAAAGPYEPPACSYPAAAPAAGFPGPPAAGAAAFPPEPAAPADSGAAAGDERKYTDLRSVPRPAGGQLDSLADLLQDKFGGWAGATGSAPAAAPAAGAAAGAAYCGTPPSEDSGVDVDECATKHAPQAEENIGQIMKKTMVESVSA